MTRSALILSPSRRRFVAGGLCAAIAARAAPGAAAQTAALPTAEAFIDTVGVNTHIFNTPYAENFVVVRELLKRSGIRHIRDELRPTNNIAQWKQLYESSGVKSTILVSPSTNTVAEMMEYLDRLGVEKVAGIEGQNEGDSDWFTARPEAGGDWAGTVVRYQQQVHAALRARYTAEQLPLISPTVLNWKPQNMLAIKGAAPYSDVVAIHSYVQHSQEPETRDDYASLAWYFQKLRDPFKPGAPVMATETGYNTMLGWRSRGVSQRAAAIYMPRLLLYNFQRGVRRTFLYELMDSGTDDGEWEHHFGLVHNDGRPKPAFTAVSALINALKDQGTPGRPQPAAPPRVTMRDAPADARLVELAQPDGSTTIAVWRAARSWDPRAKADVTVTPYQFTLVADQPLSRIAWSMPNEGGGWSDLASVDAQIGVRVDDRVLLLRLTPAA